MKPNFKKLAEQVVDRDEIASLLEDMYNEGYEDGDLHGWESCDRDTAWLDEWEHKSHTFKNNVVADTFNEAEE